MSLDPRDLIGAWSLQRYQVHFADGRPPRFPFGEEAQGLLVYAASGWVSAVLSRSDRAPLGAGGLETAHHAPAEKKAEAFDSYLSYAGRWSVEDDTVVHHVQLAAIPDVVGNPQRRRASLDGDRLTLEYEAPTRRGAGARFELVWKRAPSSPPT